MKKSDSRLYTRTTNGFVHTHKASMKDMKNGYLFQKRPWRHSNSINKSGGQKEKKTKDFNTKNKPSSKSCHSEDQQFKKKDEFKKKQKVEIKTCTKVILYTCLVLLPLSLMLTLVAMATPFWFDTGNATLGLFQICQGVPNSCENVMDYLPISTVTNTWMIVIGVESTGAVLLLLGVLALICIYPSCSFGDRRSVVFGAVMACLILLAAVSVSSGVYMMLLHSVHHAVYKLSWSFYLAVSGVGLTFFVFCFIVTFVCLTAFQ